MDSSALRLISDFLDGQRTVSGRKHDIVLRLAAEEEGWRKRITIDSSL